MKDEWKALLWPVAFLVWMFGTPIVTMYILLKWQTEQFKRLGINPFKKIKRREIKNGD